MGFKSVMVGIGKKIAKSGEDYAKQTLARMGMRKEEPGYAANPGEKSTGMMKPKNPRMSRSMDGAMKVKALNRLGKT